MFRGFFLVVRVDATQPAVPAHFLESLPRGRAPVRHVGDHPSLRVAQPDELGGRGDERAVTLFAAQGDFARAFLVVDVRAGAEPLHDPVVQVAHRQRSAQVPAVGAVRAAPQPVFHLENLAGSQALPPSFQAALRVVGMHDGRPAPGQAVLVRHARVLVKTAVEIFHGPVGFRHPDHLRHAVGGETVALDRALQFIGGLASLFDLPLERAVRRAEFRRAFAHPGFRLVARHAHFLLGALAVAGLPRELAV